MSQHQEVTDALDNTEECDHEWTFQDDSFDHEFGTEQVHYWICEKCSAQRDAEYSDYEDDYEPPYEPLDFS